MPGDSEKESSMNCVLSKIIVRVSGTRQTLPLLSGTSFRAAAAAGQKEYFLSAGHRRLREHFLSVWLHVLS